MDANESAVQVATTFLSFDFRLAHSSPIHKVALIYTQMQTCQAPIAREPLHSHSSVNLTAKGFPHATRSALPS